MNDDHRTISSGDYEVTFHPAFASSCVLTAKDGKESVLFEQKEKVSLAALKVGRGRHPKKHRLRLRGKGRNGRDITITIDDPNHAVHSIRLELYDEGRDPAAHNDPYEGGEMVTFLNMPETCPPNCDF